MPHTDMIVKRLEFMVTTCKLAGRLLIHTQVRNLQSLIVRKKLNYFKLEKL